MDAVRKAQRGDLTALAGALGRAFYDDPVFRWLFPADRRRERWNRRFFAIGLRRLLAQGEVYAAGRVGAAGWARPGDLKLGLGQALRMLPIAPGLGRRLPRSLAGLARIEERHPHDPHWYLAHLGVEPARQGEGLGSALMRPVLEGCDRDDIGAYLETATERNVDFYARHGFRVIHEVRMPGGPPVWLMWRDPR